MTAELFQSKDGEYIDFESSWNDCLITRSQTISPWDQIMHQQKLSSPQASQPVDSVLENGNEEKKRRAAGRAVP